jgi:hypothetical protein
MKIVAVAALFVFFGWRVMSEVPHHVQHQVHQSPRLTVTVGQQTYTCILPQPAHKNPPVPPRMSRLNEARA